VKTSVCDSALPCYTCQAVHYMLTSDGDSAMLRM